MTKRKTHRVTVILTDEDMSRFDNYCKEMGYKKSTLLAKLLRDYLDANQNGKPSQLGLWKEK